MHDWDLKRILTGSMLPGISFCLGLLWFCCRNRILCGQKGCGFRRRCGTGSSRQAANRSGKTRLYAPLYVEDGMDWRGAEYGGFKAMQNYCGGIKCSALLEEGLALLNSYEKEAVPW